MSRTFDSGLAAPQRSLIQAAIIQKLAPLKLQTLGGTDPKGFCQAIIPTSWRVRRELEGSVDLLWRVCNGRAPAICVAPLDLHPDQAGGPGRSVGELEIDLYFVSNHKRSLVEGRATADAIAAAADTADPGLYAMMELAWMYLFDVDLAIPTVHELKLHGEFEVDTVEKYTIWRQEWRALLGRDADMYRGITQKFTNAVTELDPTDDQPPALDIKLNTTVG